MCPSSLQMQQSVAVQVPEVISPARTHHRASRSGNESRIGIKPATRRQKPNGRVYASNLCSRVGWRATLSVC